MAVGSGPGLSAGCQHRFGQLDAAVRLDWRHDHNLVGGPCAANEQRELFLPPGSAAVGGTRISRIHTKQTKHLYFPAEGEFVLVREVRIYSLFLESMTMVTGPSLTRLTFMSAPNSPV